MSRLAKDLSILSIVVATLMCIALLATRNLGAQQMSSGDTIYTGTISAVFNSNTVLGIVPISGVGPATIVAATEGDAAQVVGRAMTCRNLYCATTNAGGTPTAAGGTAWTIAVNKNLVASTLTCAETALLLACSDTTHTIDVAAGDLLDYGWTPTGTPTAIVGKCSMECSWK